MRLPSRMGWLPALALLTLPAAAQETDEEPVLGRPAGWTALEEDASLVEVAVDSALHTEPDLESRVITFLPGLRLPLLETREHWVKVRYGDRVGWVDLEASPAEEASPPRVETALEATVETAVEREPLPELEPLPEPEPPRRPLVLEGPWRKKDFGPYSLYSLVREPGLIDYLGRLAGDHGRLYAGRYGLPEVEAGGWLLLFPSRDAVLGFQRARGHRFTEGRISGYFHSPDLVVMYRGFNSRHQLAATLIHELTHLVTWQVLSASERIPAPLPPWLQEGMADDLSLSMVRNGRLSAEPLGPGNLQYGRRLGMVLWQLERQIVKEGTAPSLPALLAMDEEAFFAGDSQLHYRMSALWVRYLLSGVDEGLADGFRAFLASVANGGSSHPDVLAARLGRTWPELAAGFRGYLLQQRARLGP